MKSDAETVITEVSDEEWDEISRLVDEREISLYDLTVLDHWVTGRGANYSLSTVLYWLRGKPGGRPWHEGLLGMAMKPVPVKLPPELKQAMEAEADRTGKSHSAFMRDALIWYLEHEPNQDQVDGQA